MRKSTKILITILIVLILLLAAMIAVPYYLLGIDIFDQSGWHTTEEGATQYLDYYGDPMLQWQMVEDNWYYFDEASGAMATGWLELDGSRYYLGEDGIRRTGWLTLSEGTYYISPSTNAAATGWLEMEEGTYYLNSDGMKLTGWVDIDGSRYYLGQDGLRVTGWTELDGKRYYLDENGVMATGWLETPEGRRYLDETGALATGWTDTAEGRYLLTEEGLIATGWVETEDGRFYLDENGQPITGWLELEGEKYYIDETGLMTVGWLELAGVRYYFKEDGTMAVGKVMIDDVANYFTSAGAYVVLVNRWNPVPEDYEVELVDYNGFKVAAECRDDLAAMIEQIKTLGYYKITSAYRSISSQQSIWNNRYYNFLAQGYSKEGAEEITNTYVAIPGTSEHHLGLAVDIDGIKAVHSWLAEHSWEYGFIVRYPDGKTDITGIVYEPWHYRYVGKELAKEIYDLGLCMEEYMDMLTEE